MTPACLQLRSGSTTVATSLAPIIAPLLAKLALSVVEGRAVREWSQNTPVAPVPEGGSVGGSRLPVPPVLTVFVRAYFAGVRCLPQLFWGPLPAPVLSGEPVLGGLRVMRMQFIGGQVCVSVPS